MLRLKVFKGYVANGRFILKRILHHEVTGAYKASGLRSMARLINNESFNFTIGNDTQIKISADKAIIMQQELNEIAEHLENL